MKFKVNMNIFLFYRKKIHGCITANENHEKAHNPCLYQQRLWAV